MFRNGFLALTWAATMCLASPAPIEITPISSSEADLLVKKGIELAQSRGLEKRLTAEFSMAKSWDNEVLFGGAWSDAQEETSESTALSIACLDCYTKGMVTAKLWEDIFHPTVRLEFDQVEAYVFLGVETSASVTFSINLFSSESPIGLGFPGLSVGVVFFVDLVFSLSEEIDLTGGFYVKLADDAYLEADIFGGDITDSFFDGISTKSLPITVITGTATFKADLRLRVQCGAETTFDFLGIGSGAVVGIYANLVEFVAVIEKTPACALETREWWDLNVGAYAHLDVVVDYTTIGPVPTVSTTLLTAPTLTQCWVDSGASSTVTLGATTSVAISSGQATVSVPDFSYPGSLSVATTASSCLSTYTSSSTGAYPTISSFPASNSFTTQGISSSSSYPLANSSSQYTASTPASSPSPSTSTVYSTTVYTITSCAADVVNCPASYQKEIAATQTFVSSSSSPFSSPPTAAPIATTPTLLPTAVHIVTEDTLVTLVPCATPIVQTFVPPEPAAQTGVVAAAAVIQQQQQDVKLDGGMTGAPATATTLARTQWANSTMIISVPSPSSSSSSSSSSSAASGYALPSTGALSSKTATNPAKSAAATDAPVVSAATASMGRQGIKGLVVAGVLCLVVALM